MNEEKQKRLILEAYTGRQQPIGRDEVTDDVIADYAEGKITPYTLEQAAQAIDRIFTKRDKRKVR